MINDAEGIEGYPAMPPDAFPLSACLICAPLMKRSTRGSCEKTLAMACLKMKSTSPRASPRAPAIHTALDTTNLALILSPAAKLDAINACQHKTGQQC